MILPTVASEHQLHGSDLCEHCQVLLQPTINITRTWSFKWTCTCSCLKHGIGADLIFLFISMLQKNCVIKEYFIELCRKALSDLVCLKISSC